MKKKYFLVAMATTLLAGTMFAQITRGTIGNGSFTDYSGYTSQAYGIDFNNDGNIEFKIADGDLEKNYITYAWSNGGNNVCASSEGWDYAALLSRGTSIGASSAWDGQGDAMINATGNGYIAFRIKLNNQVHYGWAEINISSTAVTWVKAFYQATPNQAINAGDESSASIATAQAEWDVRSLGDKTIRITADNNEELRVYDLSGRLVEKCVGNKVLQLPNRGTYVVRGNEKVLKVIVF